MKRGRVRGVPGSGKTRYLIELISLAAKKYGPSRVGAISYTNAAVEELKERAINEAGFNPGEAINIRTIHSHCWRLLSLTKDRHAEANLKDWNENFPHFSLSGQSTNEDDVSSYLTKSNDRTMTEINIMRSRMIHIEYWSPDLMALWLSWRGWMLENDLIDYTGMLEMALRLEMRIDVDVLFVDEAQDMNVLQGKLTELWAEDTVSTIWCGDSDQAIFRFAGSDPVVFDDMPVTWSKILDQSYRVPQAIQVFAHSILSRIQKRTRIDFKATKTVGSVNRVYEPDLSIPGTHMILCRCNYQVMRWINWLIDKEIIWKNQYRLRNLAWNPSKTKLFLAVQAYHRLIVKGESLNLADIKQMVGSMRVKGNLQLGAKGKIAKQQDIEDPEDIFSIQDYGFLSDFFSDQKPLSSKFFLKGTIAPLLMKNPSVVEQKPNVTVGTIHSIKGGECDHVWVDTELPGIIISEMNKDMDIYDDELRVLYVAVTRARQTLGLINSNAGIV